MPIVLNDQKAIISRCLSASFKLIVFKLCMIMIEQKSIRHSLPISVTLLNLEVKS